MLFAAYFKFLENKIQMKQLVKQGTAGDRKGVIEDRERGIPQVSKKLV